MSSHPVQLAIGADGRLAIDWSDGERKSHTIRQLREACPCATCKDRRLHPPPKQLLPVLSAAELAPLTLRGMTPVGNYAYSLSFSDGHDTGIYTIEYLRALPSDPR